MTPYRLDPRRSRSAYDEAMSRGLHPDDAYKTGGERYRTPSHPAMIEALGRAMWTVLMLEELVLAVLHEADAPDWSGARALEAGPLESRLRRLAPELVAQGAGPAIPIAINAGADAFRDVRKRYRNALAHARIYAVGQEQSGRHLPGVAHHRSDGTIARFAGPQALLDVAHHAERAIDPLGEALIVVRLWRGLAPL